MGVAGGQHLWNPTVSCVPIWLSRRAEEKLKALTTDAASGRRSLSEVRRSSEGSSCAVSSVCVWQHENPSVKKKEKKEKNKLATRRDGRLLPVVEM